MILSGVTTVGIESAYAHNAMGRCLELLAERWPSCGPGNWVQRYFGRWFGMKPKLPMPSERNPLKVVFTEKTIVYRGKPLPYVSGITLSPYEIVLRCSRATPLSATAFTHEYVHVALKRNTGGYDEDHDTSAYWGKQWTPAITAMINEVDAILAEEGY